MAGVAKSGTTALFFRIRNSLQGETALYFEPENYRDNSAGGADNTLVKVLVEKLGKRAGESFNNFDKKIFIARDIRDQLVSDLLYSTYHFLYNKPLDHIKNSFDLLKMKEVNPSSVSLLSLFNSLIGLSTEEVIERIVMLRRRSQDFLNRDGDFFLLSYEDLVAERLVGLKNYLGINLSGDIEVDPEFMRVVRTKESGSWKSWFTEGDISTLRGSIDEYLEAFHYDAGGWEVSNDPKILPAHCSLYVERVVNERRAQGNYELISFAGG